MFRDAFDFVEAKKVSDDSGLLCPEVTLTQQHMKEEADINTIVRRFGVTGMLPEAVRPPTFGDFTAVIDFRTAQDAIISAQRSFMAMSADVRDRFHNDPQEFVAFCSDPDNLDEMRKLGLAKPAVVVENPPEPVIPPAK